MAVRERPRSSQAYDMDAAFMSFQPHESGIHAVCSARDR
jgi:hypothetical protein